MTTDNAYWTEHVARALALIEQASPEACKEALLHALSIGQTEYFLPSLIGSLEGIQLRADREQKDWKDKP